MADGLPKVIGVARSWEADEIGWEETTLWGLVYRKAPVDLGRGKGDVEKEANGGVDLG